MSDIAAKGDFLRPLKGVFAAGTRSGEPADAAIARPAFRDYALIDMRMDQASRTLWCTIREDAPACFTPELLDELRHMQGAARRSCQGAVGRENTPLYFVGASRLPGIFNLGGDLALFLDHIRRQDREGLTRYARACIDIVHANRSALGLPIITIALVQGDALGGGFETALSFDLIIAEKGTKLGLPEILFNLFPGMGAYSLLSRRLDSGRAEKLILSGKVFAAEELHEMGVIDALAEPGEGVAYVEDYIRRHGRRHNAQQALYRVRRRVQPLTYAELRDVTDIWVDTALGLDPADLRKMERLLAAQDRRRGIGPAAIAAE